MKYAAPSHPILFLLLAGALALSACAHRLPDVGPEDLPRIRQEVEARPEDTDLQVQLGMALYKAQDYDQALTTLQHAVEAGNRTGAAYLYLGLTQEALEDWSGARDAYSAYLKVGKSDPLKNRLRKRLELMARRVLEAQAKAALAQEQQLGAVQPKPRSVAIFPFGFNSDREEMRPLIYALADMMITDFKVSNALTVLERAQIQTLLDEMSLTEAGYAEASTGARAGRLLRAEHVVQGVITTLGQSGLRLDTDVLNIPRSASEGRVSEENQLDKLFDIEKQVVFRTLRDVLSVQLTPAEQQAILDNRTDNLQAFLAYGQGLREQDRGNYAAAARQFQQAAQLDPGFSKAQEQASQTEDLSEAQSEESTDIVQEAAATGETGGTETVAPATSGDVTGTTATTGDVSGTLNNASEAVNPTPTASTLDLGATSQTKSDEETEQKRDPVQESQGQDNVSKTATAKIRIVIKRPGGGRGR